MTESEYPKFTLWYSFVRSLCLWYFKTFHNVRIYGEENVPANTPFILASNHESYFDPPLLSILPRELTFLARKTLFKNPIFGRFITSLNSIPIDQDKPDMTGLKNIIKASKAGQVVLIFPEGTRTEDGNLNSAMPGIGLVLTKARVPILPVRIYGCYDAWPLGGKITFGAPISIVVGKPMEFDFANLKGKDDYQKVGDDVMAAIADLKLPKASSASS